VIRWLKFSVAILVRLGMHYLVATAIAVEIALLHNYVWHKHWTWAGRTRRPGRLLRFHLANGLVSILSNLAWMRVLTGWLHVAPVPANVVAIGATALLNFALGDRWVFSQKSVDS